MDGPYHDEDPVSREECPQLPQNDTLVGVSASKDRSGHQILTKGAVLLVIDWCCGMFRGPGV